VTKFTARHEADGSVRIVVAERDPGIGGNWIDPFGHTSGIMGLRLIQTAETAPVLIHLVELSELEREGLRLLTPETGVISGELTA